MRKMRLSPKSILLLAAFLVSTAFGQNSINSNNGRVYTLTSPDGQLATHVTAGNDGKMTYDITLNGAALLQPSQIGLDYTQGTKAPKTLTVKKMTQRTVDETINTPFTRQASMRNHFNELTLQLKEGLSLVFRAYDEGIAYRFCWNGEQGTVFGETVEYRFPTDWNATVPYVGNFDSTRHEIQYGTSFENQYRTMPLSKLDPRRLCFLPLLVSASNGVKLCITESALLDYPGLYLHGTHHTDLIGENATYPKKVEQGGWANIQLKVTERESFIAKMDKNKVFPWRITMVARTDAELATNNLTYLLAEPSRIADISWIKPGKVTWEWWNSWNINGVDFKAGINNDTYKYYIDFASKYGIEYLIMDEGWSVRLKADLFQVVPEIDLPMLVKYARERNVGIILWAGHYAFERNMEEVCKHYSEMGIKGFKIDFMDRDDQLVMDFYRRAAETCAKYHLLVDFHGAFKPAGFVRTYPNILNFEGVFGLEQMRWSGLEYDQMKYDTEMPFIRQTAGPVDYTPGAMLNGTRATYRCNSMEPMSQGTRCHQLALYMVFEAPLAMLCDAPTRYEREPEYTRFLSGIPTVWDETRVLQAEVGEYIVTARRKGNTWFIGGITNWTSRDITLDLSKLQQSNNKKIKQIELYTDGANAHRNASDYKYQRINGSTQQINIHLAPGGGFAAKCTVE